MGKNSEELLAVLSDFTNNCSVSHLEALLKASSKSAAEVADELGRYGTILKDVDRLRDAYGQYEEHLMPGIEKSLTCFSGLLQKGPASRAALIKQYAVVRGRAAEINCLDEEMLEKVGEICKQIAVPKNLPAFQGSQGAPSEAEWPGFALKEIFDEKQGAAQGFWNRASLLILPEIDAATKSLKAKKETLDAIVKAMDSCVELLNLMNRIIGIAVAL